MGGERTWKRKHVFFCFACCLNVLMGLSGCLHPVRQWQAKQDMREAESLMASGAYEASLHASLKVLEAHSSTLGDEALFHIGLLYAHPENPGADRARATASFERILNEFPLSKKKEEARLWVLILRSKDKEIGRMQARAGLMEQTAEEQERILKRLQEELEEKDRELTKSQKEIDRRDKRLMDMQQEFNQINSRVTELEAQLLKLKDVDLTIEKKKRATLP